MRANALLTDYFDSDIAWVSLENPKFDVIFAPYETSRRSAGRENFHGAAVLIRVRGGRNSTSSEICKHSGFVAAGAGCPPNEVISLPWMWTRRSARRLRHGCRRCDNLPNDPRIHEQKGRRNFLQNFMDARVNYVILPVASDCARRAG
jgi:hypothetical protein